MNKISLNAGRFADFEKRLHYKPFYFFVINLGLQHTVPYCTSSGGSVRLVP